MKPRKTKDIGSQLVRKGFKLAERNHTYYYLYYNNRKTSVFTKISHGIAEYGKELLSQMARELSLTSKEFEGVLDCPISYDNLCKILRDKNRIFD